MRNSQAFVTATVIYLFTMAGTALAAESVRVVSDLAGISAGFELDNESSASLSVNVSIPAISVTTIALDSREYKEVKLPSAEFLMAAEAAEDGKPAVPALTTNLIIPDQAGVSISVSYSGYDEIEDFDLAPVQPSQLEIPDAPPVPFNIDNQAYATDALYPENLAEASEPAIMRDVRFVQVAFYPVQYNPVRRLLRVYRDLSVAVNYDSEVVNPKTTHNRYISDGFYPIYKAMFANFDQYFATAEVRRGGYVIICKPTLVDSLRAVAQWKHQKGYAVRIVTTTEINSNGNPTSQQIFNYLQNAYNTWESPPEYVMLAGDVSGTFMVSDYPYSSYASDHHYSCVDGTDYISDIFVARMSFSTWTDARKALSKIIKYEKYPWMRDPEHWIRSLSAAHTYYESARLITLWVRQLMLQNGFVRVDTVFGTNSGPLPGIFNSGLAYIQYRGAGDASGWAGPTWTSSNLLQLQSNQKLGVMASLTCGTGDFSTECFGETWIRMGVNPDSLKGGPAFYGVTDHSTHTRWNNPIMVGYYFGIFNENIYHFAAAAVRGKLQEWRTFPRYRGSGQYVEQYFNTYNMLGDPELELRTKIPIILNVSHPDTVAFGPNHLEVTVTDTAGNVIPDAFVTLLKAVDSTDEVFSVGRTDDQGFVSMSFDARTTGPMILTVSGQNLYPYQANIEIVNSDLAVGLDSVAVDDDEFGRSHGDGDGSLASGETVELRVWIKNYGTSQNGLDLSAHLETMDASAVVYDANRAFGDLAPDQTGTSELPFLIHIDPQAFDGELVRLKLTVTDHSDNSWYSLIEMPVKAPRFVVSRTLIPEGDSVISPGETSNLVIFLTNDGSLDAQNVTGTITTEDDFSNVIGAFGSFGDIPRGGTGNNSSSIMSIRCDSSTFEGRRINFILHAATQAGASAAIPFSLPVGRITRNDPAGPDAYGYYMYDTKDSSYAMFPTYQWIELSPDSGGPGTRLNYGSGTDDKSVLVTLPFDMVYYGEPRGALIICINGFVALDTFRMDMGGNFWANFFNWPIPDPGNAQGQISPFWDDLLITGSHYGIYTWFDANSHKFYIEWLKMTHANFTNIFETFQMVIFDPVYYPSLTGDSEILFIYKDVNNVDSGENYASVGFESWDEQRGLEFTHDNYYSPGAATLVDGMVIRITTNDGRGGIKGNVNLNNGGSNQGARVTASTGQYRITPQSGDFWIRSVPPGNVSLIAEAYGYFPSRLDSISVTMNQICTGADFILAQSPVPSSLTATDSLESTIELDWGAIQHTDLIGYNLYRARWNNGAYVRINTSPISDTHYVDSSVPDTGAFWYYVTAVYAIDGVTAESFSSNRDSGAIMIPTGIHDGDPRIPSVFFLTQNYPNPFNPATTISYGLPEEAFVKLDIFDIMGQKVRALADELQTAGYRTIVWDGRGGDGHIMASGVYFCRLQAGQKHFARKMLMLK